jgi:hypothetical protein
VPDVNQKSALAFGALAGAAAAVLLGRRRGSPAHPLPAGRPDPRADARRREFAEAREAAADERKRLWPKAVDHNPVWGRYQRRTRRRIPVVVLSARG